MQNLLLTRKYPVRSVMISILLIQLYVQCVFSLKIFSSNITFNGSLPNAYNCNLGVDKGISPPISWSDPPDGTNGYVLLMYSITGDYSTYYKSNYKINDIPWGLYNISADINEIPEGCGSNNEILIKSFDKETEIKSCIGRQSSYFKFESFNIDNMKQYYTGNETDEYYYNPPCSEDCKKKDYVIVLYALSVPIEYEEFSTSSIQLYELTMKDYIYPSDIVLDYSYIQFTSHHKDGHGCDNITITDDDNVNSIENNIIISPINIESHFHLYMYELVFVGIIFFGVVLFTKYKYSKTYDDITNERIHLLKFPFESMENIELDENDI